MAFSTSGFIAHKRDGHAHDAEEIERFVTGFGRGSVADYQMSAWLMAVYLRGLNDAEMVALTRAMLRSGQTMRRPARSAPRVDKHSTGGVGDKISLPLAGIAAACGLAVPMIAGRGLGHTGGTLDKLEAIAGYDVGLTARRFAQVVQRAGASIIGQTAHIAPADRRMYALRDVTATVASRPLIVASILSKKLAANLDGLVLDVKVGRGAFMTNKAAAKALARSLVQVARQLGTPTVALLSNMDQPLGRAIGNALEVRESVDILRGAGPKDATDLTQLLVSEMLLLGGVARTRSDAAHRIERSITSGLAFERFCKMVELHGGDPRLLEDPRKLPHAPRVVPVLTERAGYVTDIDPLVLAQIAQELGAGRRLVTDSIDPVVGIRLCHTVGERVQRGAPLCELHLRKGHAPLVDRARRAFTVRSRAPAGTPLILGRVHA